MGQESSIIQISASVCPANIYLARKWTLVIGPCDTKGQANNFPNKNA